MRLPAKQFTALFVVALGCGLAVRDRVGRTLASDTDTVTWGATDPTFSPHGARLAFSLFGSIWIVPADGGEASQVTNSAGYHAHPAFSPKGNRIAFIRGDAPRGPIPIIPGRLVLVDVETGREQEIRTPHPVSGTLAWSPDASRIACALRVSDAGALLHEITVADGSVKPIQTYAHGQRTGSGWVDAAWNPKRSEIFFAGARLGPPQVWTIDPAGPPITVQMPLTRYRPEDIVQLNRISALPDGSGVVYSADVVNGRGNYEVYRVGRQGGTPAAITNTARDEFSPAVSPDGKRIAVYSNEMGNTDLYTMPITGGEKKHVRLASLRFRGPAGRVRVRVLDEQGRPTRVRLYVRAADGKAYAPAGSPLYYYALEPGRREGFFVASGDDIFPAPAGKLELFALKGVEYELAESAAEVAAEQTAEVTIHMRRWTNWYQRGWYTGENHYHANYNGIYYQRPKQSLAWLEAEDMNAANMIVANNEGAFIHDIEFFRGESDPLSTARYVLFWGEEYRNHAPFGHQAFLNLKKLVPPFFTSVPGSNSPHDFPLNTMAALEAKQQGGLVTYVHPTGGVRDVLDTWIGAKEIPVAAALNAVDALDVLPFGEAAYELLYRLLNCGFKISAGAGTDVFTNWRGINQIPGGARQYVEVGGGMNWSRWVERFRQGRNFVTNGPLVTFQVNGQPIGAEIRAPEGQPYQAKLATEVSARVPLRTLEFIQNGQVIESREIPAGARTFRAEKDVTVDRSSWFAVRVSGPPARGIVAPRAHTSAIYVAIGGRPTLMKEDVELMIRWLDRLWLTLEERNNFGPGDNRERARRMVAEARKHYETKLAAAR